MSHPNDYFNNSQYPQQRFRTTYDWYPNPGVPVPGGVPHPPQSSIPLRLQSHRQFSTSAVPPPGPYPRHGHPAPAFQTPTMGPLLARSTVPQHGDRRVPRLRNTYTSGDPDLFDPGETYNVEGGNFRSYSDEDDYLADDRRDYGHSRSRRHESRSHRRHSGHGASKHESRRDSTSVPLQSAEAQKSRHSKSAAKSRDNSRSDQQPKSKATGSRKVEDKPRRSHRGDTQVYRDDHSESDRREYEEILQRTHSPEPISPREHSRSHPHRHQRDGWPEGRVNDYSASEYEEISDARHDSHRRHNEHDNSRRPQQQRIQIVTHDPRPVKIKYSRREGSPAYDRPPESDPVMAWDDGYEEYSEWEDAEKPRSPPASVIGKSRRSMPDPGASRRPNKVEKHKVPDVSAGKSVKGSRPAPSSDGSENEHKQRPRRKSGFGEETSKHRTKRPSEPVVKSRSRRHEGANAKSGSEFVRADRERSVQQCQEEAEGLLRFARHAGWSGIGNLQQRASVFDRIDTGVSSFDDDIRLWRGQFLRMYREKVIREREACIQNGGSNAGKEIKKLTEQLQIVQELEQMKFP